MTEHNTEKERSCGHPNHGGPDHDCKPFLPCDDPACPCGPRTDVERAEEAFWREQEAGTTKRDRGGYYANGFRDGYARALADLRTTPVQPAGGEQP